MNIANLSTSKNNLALGHTVCFTPSSGNEDRQVRKVLTVETHNGLVFYRISGQPNGLYLRTSLAKTRRKFVPHVEDIW